MTEQALQAIDSSDLPTKAEMDETIFRATNMARTLKKIIVDQNLGVQIGGGEHIRIEAWKTVGRFCGYVVRTEALPSEGQGARARAEVVRLSDGMVVSTADAECGTEGDETWISKPHFQQASMAQTRASGKAFRNVLDWIVTLAGYNATPAEEMVRDDKPNRYTTVVTAVGPGHPDWCDEHNREFFKTQKMRGYAHPVDGEPWHDKPDPGLTAQGQRVEELFVDVQPSGFSDVGEFMTAVQKRWGKGLLEVCQILGLDRVNEIIDLDAAWKRLEEALK
jgi:hypothetical protein